MFPVKTGMPPVGVLNQSTVVPATVETVNAGFGLPAQILGLFGMLAALTGAQLQFGAFTDCCTWHPVAEFILVIVTFVPAGIPLTVKLPALPLTVPSVTVTAVPVELKTMS